MKNKKSYFTTKQNSILSLFRSFVRTKENGNNLLSFLSGSEFEKETQEGKSFEIFLSLELILSWKFELDYLIAN